MSNNNQINDNTNGTSSNTSTATTTTTTTTTSNPDATDAATVTHPATRNKSCSGFYQWSESYDN